MRPPPGIWPFDSKDRPLVCKLRRTLYGLKQAGREWAKLFASFLIDWGMVRSTIDTCLYTFKDSDGHVLWCLVYVDDALLAPRYPERFIVALRSGGSNYVPAKIKLARGETVPSPPRHSHIFP